MLKKNNRGLLAVSLLLSFLFLGLCSKSSPLYPMNDWLDVNCFFTVGRSMLHGYVPYRDLFEHKGPILYFLYALAAAISQTSFVGAWILDAVSFGLFLYFSGLCVRLHLGNTRAVYPILIVLAAILSTTEAVAHGGSPEQMFLSFLMGSLYLIDRALCEGRRLRLWEAFVVGVCAGVALYFKFTFLGFFLGLALFVLVWYLVYDKQPRELPGIIGSFLGGIAAVSVPVFLYFLIHGAVGDFLTVYFYNNLFVYQEDEVNRLYFFAFYLYTSFRRNPLVAVPVAAAGLWLLASLKKNYKLLTAIALSGFFLAVAVLAGGRFFIYYPMIFTVYTVYGLIAAAMLWKKLRAKLPVRQVNIRPVLLVGANVLLVAALLVYAFGASRNTYLLDVEKEEMPQYRFAQRIRQKEDATLLNYGFIDGGFYFAAEVLPTNKYFCSVNMAHEEMESEQVRQIEDGLVDFVVTQDKTLEECDLDSSRYVQVDFAEMYLEEEIRAYYLYEKIG